MQTFEVTNRLSFLEFLQFEFFRFFPKAFTWTALGVGGFNWILLFFHFFGIFTFSNGWLLLLAILGILLGIAFPAFYINLLQGVYKSYASPANHEFSEKGFSKENDFYTWREVEYIVVEKNIIFVVAFIKNRKIKRSKSYLSVHSFSSSDWQSLKNFVLSHKDLAKKIRI